MPTSLVAVSGMSPAILTETIWALAHESPPVIPDEVIVITTSKGAADLQRDLLTKSPEWKHQTVWESLRHDLFKLLKTPKASKLQLSTRVIDLPDEKTGVRVPAEDLRTRAHHDQAANFIIQQLSSLCDAEDHHVIASIAGGRKSMGALLYAAMSLLGKETDRVTHVLVNEPFDSVRGFFYPDQPVQQITARLHGKAPFTVNASDARIDLADIPFVPLRNKFDELNERRTFAGLVDAYSKAERPLTSPPHVELDLNRSQLIVQSKAISLTGRELLTAAFLILRANQGLPHYDSAPQAEEDYQKHVDQFKQQHPHHKALSRAQQKPCADDLIKALSSIRKKLAQAGLSNTIPYLAPERKRIGFDITQCAKI